MGLSKSQLAQFQWGKIYNGSAGCRQKYVGDDYCNVTDINAPLDAVIIGDSHANYFYWGLSDYYKNKRENLINLGGGGCPPFIGIDMGGPSTSPNCYTRMKPFFAFILSDQNVKTVYISFLHDAYFADNLVFTDKLNQIEEENNYRYVLNAMVRTIKLLEGKQVILLYDLPDLEKDIKSCFLIRPILETVPCKLDSSMFVNDFDRYRALVEELTKRTSVKVFDTHRFLEGNFPVDGDGIPTYRDYSHLSIKGAWFFTDKYSYQFIWRSQICWPCPLIG